MKINRNKSTMIKNITLYMLLSVLLSCNNSSTESTKDISILNVESCLVNYPLDMNMTIGNDTMFINFRINFTQQDILSSDIKSLIITTPSGMNWIYNTQSILNELMNSGYGDLSTGYLYNEVTPNILPIGLYEIEIILHNGNKDSININVPAPNSEITDGFVYVFSEEYSGPTTPTIDYVQTPKRAIINSSTLNVEGTELTIKFTADGQNIYSGFVYLYDINKNYLGYSNYFRNYTTDSLSAILNNGLSFYTDGTSENTLLIRNGDINFIKNNKFVNEIYYYRISLTDGQQYQFSTEKFKTESISSLGNVTHL